MLSIFSRKRAYTDLSWVGTDVHSHILPGIDDGAVDSSQSKAMLVALQQMGIHNFYFTPHIFQEFYPNTPDRIAGAFQEICPVLPATVQTGYAAEYMLDQAFEAYLAQGPVELLTLPGNYILVEMSYVKEASFTEKLLFDLQVRGYKPILAHPERYVYYHGDPKRLERFKEIGCLLQLNLLSLYGYYGRPEKKTACYLLDRGVIDLVGTDVHHDRHIRALQHGVEKEDLSPYFKHCKLRNEELFAQPFVASKCI